MAKQKATKGATATKATATTKGATATKAAQHNAAAARSRQAAAQQALAPPAPHRHRHRWRACCYPRAKARQPPCYAHGAAWRANRRATSRAQFETQRKPATAQSRQGASCAGARQGQGGQGQGPVASRYVPTHGRGWAR